MYDLEFLKMEGCGNDYVFVDCLRIPLPVDPGHLARVLSNRHTAVGADGLVLILPPWSSDTHAFIRMFNTDGTESSMCGTALRCAALWLYQSGHVTELSRLQIGQRIVVAEIRSSIAEQRAGVVTVKLGPPDRQTPVGSAHDFPEHDHSKRSDPKRFGPGMSEDSVSEPFLRRLEFELECLPPEGRTVLYVSIGNPHVVCFLNSIEGLEISRVGPLIEHDVRFADRTNVDFVQKIDRRNAMVRVWERGCGETRSCGSGACAVAVAGILAGEFDRSHPVSLRMPGGVLQVYWDVSDDLHLTGPVRETFRGTIRVDSVSATGNG